MEQAKPSLWEEQSRPSLREDSSGAIMVMGIFMAVFLVGMLYYIVGLGQTIQYRELMQDTSDGGTFTAAVVNARGMNLIVMLNLIMAAIMAILLSLKIIEVVIIAAMAIAAGIGIFCGGCTAPAISFLNSLRTTVGRVADGFEEVAKVVIKAANIGQIAIKYAWPAVGQGRAIYNMIGNNAVGASPSTAGGTFPLYAALPVEDHVFIETCNRGARMAGDLVSAPFALIPLIGGKVRGWIRGAVEGLYRAYASYYCGGGPQPTPSVEVDVGRPQTPRSRACENSCEGETIDGCGACSDESSEACKNAIATVCFEGTQEVSLYGPEYCHPSNLRRGEWDPDTGDDAWCNVTPTRWDGCYDEARMVPGAIHRGDMNPSNPTGALINITPVNPNSPNIRGECLDRVNAATSSCGTGNVKNIQWGTEDAYVVYLRTSAADAATCTWTSWVPTPAQLEEAGIRNHRPQPDRNRQNQVCPNGWGPQLANPWDSSCQEDVPGPGNLARMNDTFMDELGEQAACQQLSDREDTALSRIRTGSMPRHGFRRGTRTEVYSCTRREDKPIDVDFGDTASDSPGEWKPPQRVCEHGGRSSLASTECPSSGEALGLGDNDFQIRGIAVGEAFETVADRGTRVATWNTTEGPGGRSTRAYQEMTGLSFVRGVGRGSISQAEFFWDQHPACGGAPTCCGYNALHPNSSIEWMWDMAWTARLRRINFSGNDSSEASQSGVGSVFSVIGSAASAVFAH